MTTTKGLLLAGTALVLAMGTSAAFAQTTITIESWRTDDLAIWQDQIIPAFEAQHPEINVEFVPTNPPEYDAAVSAKLDGGSAGDIITCRPFDKSLALYDKGQLTNLNDLAGMSDFSSVAKSAWTTDDASTTFCVPMASVIHGFIYNKDIFEELGLTEPTTVDEFYAVLDKIKADGKYVPLAIGAIDQWDIATMGYQNIGPSYWKGEEGRLALIAGTEKLTDDMWVEPYRQLAKWADYAGDGFEARTYPDSQNLFTLGEAAIYPSGSWEIGLFNTQADFEMGAFPPPKLTADDKCYISDHTDIGIGLNAASAHPEEAKTFLSWVASAEFGTIFANALPGFYPLSDAPITVDDPLAQEFISWRGECEKTIRSTYAILSRGTPALENETWNASSQVFAGTETPEDAAARLQAGLDAWYKPGA